MLHDVTRLSLSGTPVRAILDTNVLIRAVMNPCGIAAHLCERANETDFVSITSHYQLFEFRRVLQRSWIGKRSTSDRRHGFYVEYAERCEMYGDAIMRWPRVRDPDDDYLVELAQASNACIVTGDSDLFAATMPPGVEVHSVGWFSRNLLHIDVDAFFPHTSAANKRSA